MSSASWSIPALAEEVGSVRHAAVEFARAEGVPNPPLEDLRLAISEAATNAVIHAFRRGVRFEGLVELGSQRTGSMTVQFAHGGITAGSVIDARAYPRHDTECAHRPAF